MLLLRYVWINAKRDFFFFFFPKLIGGPKVTQFLVLHLQQQYSTKKFSCLRLWAQKVKNMYYLNALFDHATTNWCMTIKTSLDTFFFPFSETIFNRLAKFIFWRTNLKNQLQQNFQMQNFSKFFFKVATVFL